MIIVVVDKYRLIKVKEDNMTNHNQHILIYLVSTMKELNKYASK